jgi:hypothetical protein
MAYTITTSICLNTRLFAIPSPGYLVVESDATPSVFIIIFTITEQLKLLLLWFNLINFQIKSFSKISWSTLILLLMLLIAFSPFTRSTIGGSVIIPGIIRSFGLLEFQTNSNSRASLHDLIVLLKLLGIISRYYIYISSVI